MKNFILLLALVGLSFNTFSATGKNCTLNLQEHDLNGDALELLSERFTLTEGDSRYKLKLAGKCKSGSCEYQVTVLENTTSGKLRNSGNRAMGRGGKDLFTSAEDVAIADAISKLENCRKTKTTKSFKLCYNLDKIEQGQKDVFK